MLKRCIGLVLCGLLYFTAAPVLAQCTSPFNQSLTVDKGFVWYDDNTGNHCGCANNSWVKLGQPNTPICVEAELPVSGNRSTVELSGRSNGKYSTCYGNEFEHSVYNVTVPRAGQYRMTFTYASAERPYAALIINNGPLQRINLGCSGTCMQGATWDIFTDRTGTVSLNAGLNTIRIQGPTGNIGTNGGGACFRLDKVCFVPNSCDVDQCKAPPATASNACGYTERGKIGTWTDSYGNTLDVQTRQFTRDGVNAWLLVTVPTSPVRDKHFARGNNFLSNVTLSGPFNASCLGGGDTAYWGLSMPFGLTTPTGYHQISEADGAIYFQRPVECPSN